MKIIIAYLYYNLLNFHGENGNIKILKKVLQILKSYDKLRKVRDRGVVHR